MAAFFCSQTQPLTLNILALAGKTPPNQADADKSAKLMTRLRPECLALYSA